MRGLWLIITHSCTATIKRSHLRSMQHPTTSQMGGQSVPALCAQSFTEGSASPPSGQFLQLFFPLGPNPWLRWVSEWQPLITVPLFVTPWTVAHQTPLSMGFPGKNIEWVAIPFSRGSSWPRDWAHVSWDSCLVGRLFTAEAGEGLLTNSTGSGRGISPATLCQGCRVGERYKCQLCGLRGQWYHNLWKLNWKIERRQSRDNFSYCHRRRNNNTLISVSLGCSNLMDCLL